MTAPEVPTEHRGYPGLNALRAAGALMVLTTHTGFDTGQTLRGWTGAVIARMDFGVALFFVLSGFLLGRPFLLRGARGLPRAPLRSYFWKRALRILPLYWAVVVATMVFAPGNGYVTPIMWLRNLTLTQLYRPDLLPQGLTQMWSLATEAAFYLVLPLLCALLLGRRARRRSPGLPSRRIFWLLGLVSVAGVAWQAHVAPIPGAHGHYAQWLPGYLPWFCVGLALATASVQEQLGSGSSVGRWLQSLAQDPLGCWVAAALVFGLACTPLAGPRTLVSPTSWEAACKCVLFGVSSGLFVLPLVFGHLQEHPIRRVCNHPVPFFLGEISYGIFCVHVLVLNDVMRRAEFGIFQGHFLTVWTITTAVSIGLATLTYYAVERPFLRLKTRVPSGTPGGGDATTRPAVAGSSAPTAR